jgi:hypothetical protein
LIPTREKIRDRAAHEHEVDVAGTDDLIRDRHVAAAGVADVGHWERSNRVSRNVLGEKRLIPTREKIRDRAAHEHEVDVAGTDDLIRDRHVAAAGVADVGNLHFTSVS